MFNKSFGPRPNHGETKSRYRMRCALFHLLLTIILAGLIVTTAHLIGPVLLLMFVLVCLAGFTALAMMDNLIAGISSWLRNGRVRYDEGKSAFSDSA